MAFSCTFPDIEAQVQSDRVQMTLSVKQGDDDAETIYDEQLYADGDRMICLTDVDRLLQPYATKWLTFTLSCVIKEIYSSSVAGDQDSFECQIISCKANIVNLTAEQFCSQRFLTLIDGPKHTAPWFKEYLSYIGDDDCKCMAYYDTGDNEEYDMAKLAEGDYSMVDVSPRKFYDEGRRLVRYVITAGDRAQEFIVNHDYPSEIAPILLFWNSFGVQEIAYCTGEHQMVSSFERKQARIGRLKQSYSVEDAVTFKADTGVLTFPMANWWREVFRSKDIEVLPVQDREVKVAEGMPVVIKTEKVELSNAPDELPRFTFEYEYADRNHNVFDTRRDGRIFDNTFDYTFN